MMGAARGFSEKELASAKLPPPPEEDTQFDVLLRPGLLADVSILIERIPNAIHVPMQAVFEKEGKPVVYVKTGNKFDMRVIKPAKRSESTMVIADGVKPGEIVALSDPTAKKSDAKGKEKGPGGPMGALPGGKQ
jgi:HlyD family secretion protein